MAKDFPWYNFIVGIDPIPLRESIVRVVTANSLLSSFENFTVNMHFSLLIWDVHFLINATPDFGKVIEVDLAVYEEPWAMWLCHLLTLST